MESYVMIVQDFDSKISESTRQFEKRLDCLERTIKIHCRDVKQHWLRRRKKLYQEKKHSLENVVKFQQYKEAELPSLVDITRSPESSSVIPHYHRSVHNRRRQSRRVNLAKAAITLLTESSKREVDGVTELPLRVQNWWDIFAQEHYPDEQCIEYLKCSRKTYVQLVKSLRPHLRCTINDLPGKSKFDISNGTSVEKQVAVTLHKLSRCPDYSLVSAMFGINKSTIHRALYRVVSAINRNLLKTLIKMPKDEEASMISRQLEEITMIPQLLGALESIHLPISMNDEPAFKNSRNYHSFVLQTVVDANCCFRDVSVRHPGAAKDHRVLDDSRISKLWKHVIPMHTRNIENHEIPYKIAASSSYPMLPWLLTEYEPAITPGENCFNDHLRIARWCSNAAIARLKGRFEILSRSIDVNYKIAPQIIAACCAIHNMCENNQDSCLDEWLIESRKFDAQFPQPERERDERTNDSREIASRDAIRDYIEARLLLQDSDPIRIDDEFTTAAESV